MASGANYEITVHRKHTQFFGVAVRERVRIDGTVVGTLGRGEERSFPVTVGEHVVQVRAGPAWLPGSPKSGKLTVSVPPSVSLETEGYMASARKGALVLYDAARPSIRTEAPEPPESKRLLLQFLVFGLVLAALMWASELGDNDSSEPEPVPVVESIDELCEMEPNTTACSLEP